MGGDEGSSEELGTEEGQVIVDRDGLGFCVKMVDVGHLHAACGSTKGSILEGLDFIDGGGGGIGKPNGSCISVEGPDE